MNKKYRILGSLLVGLAAAAAVAHEEEGAPPPQGWAGSIAAGYVAVSGNSDSSNANLKTAVSYNQDRWEHSGLFTALGASQDGETNAEAYKAQLKSKFDLRPATYAFGLADYNTDRFSGYDYQIFEVVGLGWRVLKSARHELNLEAGIGATQSKLRQTDPPDLPLSSSERQQDEFIGRLGADYHWHISDTALFSQSVATNIGSENTYVESLTELKAGIVGNIALVLGYLVKHNTDVPPATDKTDTQTSISLEYKF